MRNSVASIIVLWRLVKLFRKEEIFVAYGRKSLFDLFRIVVDLLISFLRLRLIRIHEYLKRPPKESSSKFETISTNHLNTFILDIEIEVII